MPVQPFLYLFIVVQDPGVQCLQLFNGGCDDGFGIFFGYLSLEGEGVDLMGYLVDVVPDGRQLLPRFLHQLAVSLAAFYHEVVAVIAEIQHDAAGKAAETFQAALPLKVFEITVFIFRYVHLP